MHPAMDIMGAGRQPVLNASMGNAVFFCAYGLIMGFFMTNLVRQLSPDCLRSVLRELIGILRCSSSVLSRSTFQCITARRC